MDAGPRWQKIEIELPKPPGAKPGGFKSDMALTLAKARREFDKALPRLVGAYESGRLVPFIGSGLSAGACTSWPEMIARLETRAFDERGRRSNGRAKPSDLIERANGAVRALKTGAPRAFEKAMRYAVVARPDTIPKATRALAKVWWPLVLSTNYDNCYIAAFLKRYPNELYGVVGRSAEDCQRVLTSLTNPGRALLWALQGHMNVPCRVELNGPAAAERAKLEGELVVGHEEYRRVTYRDPGFRRAFAEVFRQRSLFFLGAGIKESYLQELFGEVLEIYGPSSRPHYAIMPRGEVDPDFMLARFQIRVLEFPDGQYGEVERWLGQLVEAVRSRTQRPFAWSYGGVHPAKARQWYGAESLRIERSFLPAERRSGECMLVTGIAAGNRLRFTPAVARRFKTWGIADARPKKRSGLLREYVGAGVFAIRSAANAGASGLTHVYDAAGDAFRRIGSRFHTIHMQLVATRAGKAPNEDPAGPGFPARFVLIQTVRAWRDWRVRHPKSRRKLVLHVLADSVTMEIAAGRLDVLELLSCDDVRFSAEIVRDDRTVERRVFELPPRTTRLQAVTRQLDLRPRQWKVEVSPRPSLHRAFRPELRVETSLGRSLHELGVVPGSTLHFRRAVRRPAP